MIYKTLHRKLKIKERELHKNVCERMCPGRGDMSCPNSGTYGATLVTTLIINEESTAS